MSGTPRGVRNGSGEGEKCEETVGTVVGTGHTRHPSERGAAQQAAAGALRHSTHAPSPPALVSRGVWAESGCYAEAVTCRAPRSNQGRT